GCGRAVESVGHLEIHGIARNHKLVHLVRYDPSGLRPASGGPFIDVDRFPDDAKGRLGANAECGDLVAEGDRILLGKGPGYDNLASGFDPPPGCEPQGLNPAARIAAANDGQGVLAGAMLEGNVRDQPGTARGGRAQQLPGPGDERAGCPASIEEGDQVSASLALERSVVGMAGVGDQAERTGRSSAGAAGRQA